MMYVIVEVCRAFALTVSVKKTDTICMPPLRTSRTMVIVEAAGQTYKQVQSFTYLGGAVTQNPIYARLNYQVDPRMLDSHQAVPTGALRPAECVDIS